MKTFDPDKVARYETENWVAYYQKDWFKLLRVSVAMVKESFGLSLPQAIYGAYLVARAEMAAAPFPDNNIPAAIDYMTRFMTLIKRIHHASFEPGEAARKDVNWWVVHRKLFNQRENQPLVEALAESYATTYQVPASQVQAAAWHRAEAMQHSDRWVAEGKADGSPLIGQMRAELEKSYRALRAAIG